MSKKIEDLREDLFATIKALRDKENPMDLARAQTIANVAKVIVDSAKVEVDFLKVTGERESTDFFPLEGETVPDRKRLPQ